MLQEVISRTVKLVAKWQAVGFTHGVLNTDNMSILGETIDYGPFGFIERFDPNFTPNTTDFAGRRYAFRNQPQVVQWNLMALATSLVTVGLIEKVTLDLVLIGLLYKAYPDGCQHRFTNPAEAKALPRQGASALVLA